MKISTLSWHYRLIDTMQFDHPQNLCGYFWFTGWCLILVPMIVAMVLFFVFTATLPFWYIFSEKWFGPVPQIIGVVEAGALFVWLKNKIKDRHIQEYYDGTREKAPPSDPSLLRLWLRAKHNKVCPVLTFERPNGRKT